MSNSSNSIISMESKPYLININDNKFGVEIIIKTNTNTNTKKIIVKDEYCFFNNLNELVFEIYEQNLQDYIQKVHKKDIYNVLKKVYDDNKNKPQYKEKIIHFIKNTIPNICVIKSTTTP
jgi:hypothetical protein